ncbi:MAG: tetratricopeptide repeat protein [Cyanobacteria bacterium J06555_13]
MKIRKIVFLSFFLCTLSTHKIAGAQSVEQLSQQGQTAQDLKDYAEAEAIWRQVIDLEPSSTEAYVAMGKALYFQGRLEEAVATFNSALTIDPNHALARLGIADSLRMQGAFEQALQAYRLALESDTMLALAHTGLGTMLAFQSDYENAVLSFQAALSIDPQDALAYAGLGYSKTALSQPEEAVGLFEESLNLPDVLDINSSAHMRAYMGLGNALSLLDRPDASAEAYQSAIQLFPENPFPKVLLAGVFANQGRFADATQHLEEALRLDDFPGVPASAHVIAHNALGDIYQQQNQYAAAAQEYQQALAIAPDFVFARNNLSAVEALLSQTSKPAESTIESGEDAKEVISQSPGQTSQTGSGQLVQAANAAHAAGAYAESEALWRQLIQSEPENSFAHSGLGIALGSQGRFEEAVFSFQRALEIQPRNANAQSGIGDVLRIQGQYEDAVLAYRQALKINANLSQAYAGMGYALASLGKPDEAAVSFRQALELNPRDVPAILGLGNALAALGEWQESIELFQRVLELPSIVNGTDGSSSHANAHISFGNLYTALNQLENANASFQQAVDLSPNSALAYLGLSGLASLQGNADEASELLRTVLKLPDMSLPAGSTHATAYNGLGYILQQQGQYEKAVEYYQQALEVAPNFVFARNNLREAEELVAANNQLLGSNTEGDSTASDGNPSAVANRGPGELIQQANAAYAVGDYPKAEAVWRRLIQVDPKNSYAYSGLGLVLGTQSKFQEAITQFQTALELDPRNASAQSGIGDAWRILNQFDEAIRAYRSAIEINANWPQAYSGLGYTLSFQGKYDEAITSFRQALELNQRDSQALIGLGFALPYVGNYQEAIGLFERVLELPDAVGGVDGSSNHANAYIGLGNIYTNLGQLDKSSDYFQNAIDLFPNSALAHFGLGGIANAQNDSEKASELFREVLRLPDLISSSGSTHATAHNALGFILQQKSEYEAAAQQYQQALTINPNLVFARNSLREVRRLIDIKPENFIEGDAPFVPNDSLMLVKRPVVVIHVRCESETCISPYARGTGWVVKREGIVTWILTNRHVLTGNDELLQPNPDSVEIELFSNRPESEGGRMRLPASIVQMSDNLDLALLEVIGVPSDIQPLPISEQPVPRNIQIVGYASEGNPWSVEDGTVTNQNETELQISNAVLSSNNSGSPIVSGGEVVGILYGTRSPGEDATGGFGIAYPMNYLVDTLRQWNILD